MNDKRQEVIRKLKDKNIYKVFCEYYIEAKDRDEAIDIVADDMAYNNFLEEHIIIEESELPKGEGVFNEE